jgi:hypothetical protein
VQSTSSSGPGRIAMVLVFPPTPQDSTKTILLMARFETFPNFRGWGGGEGSAKQPAVIPHRRTLCHFLPPCSPCCTLVLP